MLIIRNEHEILLHVGLQAMLANSRLKYWIIGERYIARHIFYKCMSWFWLRPKILDSITSSLPTENLEPSKPFKKCGVDYAGPICIKTSLHRNAATLKGYIWVSVCVSTRAVHIELVTDLFTEAFSNWSTFKNDIGRHGVCSDKYSDNTMTFVGADKKTTRAKKCISMRAVYKPNIQCFNKRGRIVVFYSTSFSPFWRIIGGLSKIH